MNHREFNREQFTRLRVLRAGFVFEATRATGHKPTDGELRAYLSERAAALGFDDAAEMVEAVLAELGDGSSRSAGASSSSSRKNATAALRAARARDVDDLAELSAETANWARRTGLAASTPAPAPVRVDAGDD